MMMFKIHKRSKIKQIMTRILLLTVLIWISDNGSQDPDQHQQVRDQEHWYQ